MTDLRTAAQAVIDTWDEYGVTACIVHIEALRQALADTPSVDALLADCRAEIERLSKPYVPMTDDEITEATQVMKHDLLHEPTLYCWRQVEKAVIKRAGLDVAK